MDLKQFQYFLLTEDGKSYVIQNGVVKTIVTPTPLRNTPNGWQDILISWDRDLNKIGNIRNFSFPLGFVLDSATILRHIFFNQDIEQKVYLLIAQLELDQADDDYHFVYRKLYKGELDFSTFKSDEDKVTINIMEGGTAKKLKANENTVYEFPLKDPESIIVKMDGIYVTESKRFLVIQGLTLENNCIRATFVNSEGSASGVAASTQVNGPISDTNYFLYTSSAIEDIQITGQLKIKSGPIAPTATINVYLKKSDGSTVATVVSQSFTNTEYTTVDIDTTFDSEEGESYFLTTDTTGDFTMFAESEFSVVYSSRYKTTYVRAFKPLTLGKKLAKAVTGSENNFSSSIIEQNNLQVITCGDAMRGIEAAKIKTTINNFFESHKIRLAAGLQVKGEVIYIEEYDYFFNDDNIVDLGSVKDLKVGLATELMGNTLKIGPNPKQIDDVNGKSSFHNTQIYSSPITRINKELQFIDPYVTDCYYIELRRINLEGKTTTDNDSDNEVMVLDVIETVNEFTVSEGSAGVYFDRNLIFFSGVSEQQPNFHIGNRFTISGAPINNQTFTIVNIGPVVDSVFYVMVEEPIDTGSMDGATVTMTSYELNRPAFDSIEGIPEVAQDSIFNVNLSPKRIFNKHQRWWNSIFGFPTFIGKKLEFRSTDKNDTLKTTLGSEIITEKSDYTFKSTKLFKPYVFEFDTEVPIDLAATLEANPNTCFRFTWDNVSYKGFILKAGLAPNTRADQTYKLLSHPDNNLSNLV